MKLTPYRKLLSMGKDAVNEMMAPSRTKAARKQAELEQAKLEEKLATLQNELQERCSEQQVDFAKIIDKLDEIGLTERKLRQFEKILTEMFPGE